MSDSAILEELGKRLRRERLNRNLTQADLAETSGIGRRTLIKAEAGEVTTLATLVALLRGLKLLPQLEHLIPEPSLSPVQLAKLQGKVRQRASSARPRSKGASDQAKKARGKITGNKPLAKPVRKKRKTTKKKPGWQWKR